MTDSVEIFARHAVQMERLKASEAAKFKQYAKAIDRILRDTVGVLDIQNMTPSQIDIVVASAERAIAAQVAAWSATVQAGIMSAAVYEAGFTATALNTLMVVKAVIPPEDIVRAVVMEAVYGSSDWKAGATIKAGMTNFEQSASSRLANQIRLGYFEGKTTTQLSQQLRGLASLNYRDGELARLAGAAETMARDSFQLATGAAKQATLTANEIDRYEWVSVLDNRTSTRCRSLDGKIFEVGKGLLPPAHPNCRSTVSPVIPKRLQALSEGGTRNTETGVVDSSTSYYSWLKTQDREYVESILGQSRTALLLEGGLSADRFAALQLNRNFDPITLDDMRKIDPLAFKRAGLTQ